MFIKSVEEPLILHSKIQHQIMKTHWRLICSSIGENGAWNMALDEAILKSVSEKKAPPTLRLYTWQPATLSLGFAQPVQDVEMARLEHAGWGWVRRPTGGRAILHIDELTYSVTAPLDDPLLAGSLLESYRKISLALLAALTKLGVEAAGDKTYASGSASAPVNPVCFETPSNYEITAAGRKLIGSAQARKYGGILQHGALPISGDITRITRVLNLLPFEGRKKAAENLNEHATNLETLLGFAPSWQAVADAMIAGFSETFDISFVEEQPTILEIDLTKQLIREKYSSYAWNFRH